MPRHLKLPLYELKRRLKHRPGIGDQMVEALEAWYEKYGDAPERGTEPYDPRRDHGDDDFLTVAVSFPNALKDKISEAAEARKLHNPRLWPDSINAVGIQALKEYLKTHGKL
ncbi:MAG: hypothetical protein QM783_16030 [Phycisphaerales bacterium]